MHFACRDLVGKMKGWYESYSPGSRLTIENRPFAVTPHLVCAHQTTSSFYALVSDTGKALFVDYGSASGNYFNQPNAAAPVGERMRFVEHTIPELRARHAACARWTWRCPATCTTTT